MSEKPKYKYSISGFYQYLADKEKTEQKPKGKDLGVPGATVGSAVGYTEPKPLYKELPLSELKVGDFELIRPIEKEKKGLFEQGIEQVKESYKANQQQIASGLIDTVSGENLDKRLGGAFDVVMGTLGTMFSTVMLPYSFFSPTTKQMGKEAGAMIGQEKAGEKAGEYLANLVYPNPLAMTGGMIASELGDKALDLALEDSDISEEWKNRIKQLGSLATFIGGASLVSKGLSSFDKSKPAETTVETPLTTEPKGLLNKPPIITEPPLTDVTKGQLKIRRDELQNKKIELENELAVEKNKERQGIIEDVLSGINKEISSIDKKLGIEPFEAPQRTTEPKGLLSEGKPESLNDVAIGQLKIRRDKLQNDKLELEDRLKNEKEKEKQTLIKEKIKFIDRELEYVNKKIGKEGIEEAKVIEEKPAEQPKEIETPKAEEPVTEQKTTIEQKTDKNGRVYYWDTINKKRTTKENFEREQSAIQKQSTNEMDVRKPTEGSEALGEGNKERQEIAREETPKEEITAEPQIIEVGEKSPISVEILDKETGQTYKGYGKTHAEAVNVIGEKLGIPDIMGRGDRFELKLKEGKTKAPIEKPKETTTKAPKEKPAPVQEKSEVIRFLEEELPSKLPKRKELLDLGDYAGEVNVKPIPTNIKPQNDKIKPLKDIASEVVNRSIRYIYEDAKNKSRVATDGTILVALEDKGIKEDAFIDPKSLQKASPNEKFPDYKSVIPVTLRESSINTEKIINDLAGLVRASKFTQENISAKLNIDGVDIYFNPELLFNAFKSLKSAGVKDIKLEFAGKDKPLILKDKGNPNNFALIMPLREGEYPYKNIADIKTKLIPLDEIKLKIKRINEEIKEQDEKIKNSNSYSKGYFEGRKENLEEQKRELENILKKEEQKPQSKIEQLRKEALDELNNLSSGFNPKLMINTIKTGAYYFREGLNTFSQWSKKMIEDFGNKIKPHLLNIWSEIKKFGKDLLEIGADKIGQFIESKYNPLRPLKISDEELFNLANKYGVKNADIFKKEIKQETKPIVDKILSTEKEGTKEFKELSKSIEELLYSSNVPKETVKRMLEKIAEFPDKTRKFESNNLGLVRKKFVDMGVLLTRKLGAIGGEFFNLGQEFVGKRNLIQDKLFELINPFYEKFNEIGKQAVYEKYVDDIVKALEDRANKDKYLKDEISKSMYDSIEKMFDYTKTLMEENNIKTLDNYFPMLLRELMIDKLMHEEAGTLSKAAIREYYSTKSPFTKERKGEIPDELRDMKLHEMLIRYIFSVSKNLAGLKLEEFYNKGIVETINNTPTLRATIGKNIDVANQYFKNLIYEERATSLTTQKIEKIRRNLYKAYLWNNPKSAMQNFGQRWLVKLYVPAETYSLAKKLYRQIPTGRLADALAEIKSFDYTKYLETEGRGGKETFSEKIDTFRATEKGNWNFSELAGVLNIVHKINPKAKTIAEINEVLSNQKYFDLAIREGRNLSSRTQFNPSQATRPSIYNSWYVRTFFMFTRYPISTGYLFAKTVLNKLEGIQGERARVILERGLKDPESIKPVEMLRTVETFRKNIEIAEKELTGNQAFGVKRSDIKSYISFLKKMEKELNGTIKNLEPMNKGRITKTWLQYLAYSGMVVSIYNQLRGLIVEGLTGEEQKKSEDPVYRAYKTMEDVSPVPLFRFNFSDPFKPALVPEIEYFVFGNFTPKVGTKQLLEFGFNATPYLGIANMMTGRFTGKSLAGRTTDYLFPKKQEIITRSK